jgi:hypothetical protein
VKLFLRILMIALMPSLAWAGSDPTSKLDLIGYSDSDSVGITSTRIDGQFGFATAVKSGDALLYVQSYGYNGTAVTTTMAACMKFIASQNWTTTANGTYIKLNVTPNGGVTSREAMRITPNEVLFSSGTTTTPGAVMVTNFATSTYRIASGFQLMSATGTISLTGTPTFDTTTFSNGFDLVLLSTASNITLNSQSVAFPNTCLQLDAATVVISTFTPIHLKLYNGLYYRIP